MSVPVKRIVDFYLAKEERTSTVWLNLKDRLEKKLVSLRKQNDNPNLTDVETATLRGHIECLKEVISLGDEPPAMVAAPARPAPRRDYGAQYG